MAKLFDVKVKLVVQKCIFGAGIVNLFNPSNQELMKLCKRLVIKKLGLLEDYSLHVIHTKKYFRS